MKSAGCNPPLWSKGNVHEAGYHARADISCEELCRRMGVTGVRLPFGSAVKVTAGPLSMLTCTFSSPFQKFSAEALIIGESLSEARVSTLLLSLLLSASRLSQETVNIADRRTVKTAGDFSEINERYCFTVYIVLSFLDKPTPIARSGSRFLRLFSRQWRSPI